MVLLEQTVHIQLLVDDDHEELLRDADAHIGDFKLSTEKAFHVDESVVTIRCNEDVVNEHSM
jgi:hypothetical protein